MTGGIWALLGLLSLVWGGSFFFIAVAVAEVPVFTLVWARVALGALALWLFVALRGTPIRWSGAGVLACLGMGVLNNAVPFSLIVYGQASIPSGLASILNATTPLFTVLAAHVLTREDKLTLTRVAGVLLGLAGVAVLLGPDLLRAGAPVLPQVAVLCGALSYGLAGVWSRRFKGLGLSPLAIAAGQLTASATLMLPLMLAVERPWQLALPGPAALAAVLGLALVSTAFAYLLFFHILDRAGPTNLSLVTFLIPVSATLLGWAFLGERLGWPEAAGAALIGCGLAAMDGRLLPWMRRRATPSG